MNVVGKVGSLITQGVYSVATPFHPFGGAVDIIVVQQQDGSFRSTPWYVQFGKFQGVLKGAEKIVRINVNGVETNFHMYLDNSGEAYFVREVNVGDDSEKNGVSKDEGEGTVNRVSSEKISSVSKESVEVYRLQSTKSDPGVIREDYSSLRPERLERMDSDACRFYDFQDDQSFDDSVELSSEYGSSRYENLDVGENFVEEQGTDSEMVLVSVDGHILMAPISSSEQSPENVQLATPQFHLGPGEGHGFCGEDGEFSVSETSWTAGYLNNIDASSPVNPGCVGKNTNSLEEQSEVCKDGKHGYTNQVTDNVYQSKVQKEDDVHANRHEHTDEVYQVEACKEDEKHVNKGIGDVHEAEALEGGQGYIYQDQETRDTHELEHVEQNQEARAIHQHENSEVDSKGVCNDQADSISDRGVECCVCNDVMDSPNSLKNDDVFSSCLDLTKVAIEKETKAKDSSMGVQEEGKDIEEKPLQSFKASNDYETESSQEKFPTDVRAIDTATNEVKRDSMSSHEALDSLKLVSSHAALRKEIQTDEQIATSVDVNKSQDKDEHVGLHSNNDAVERSPESDTSEATCSRSEVVDPGAMSFREEMQAISSSRLEISLCRHLLLPGMGLSAADEAFNAHRISQEEFQCSSASVVKNENLVIRFGERYLSWDKAAPFVLGMAAFGSDLPIDPKDAIPVQEEAKPKLGEDSRSPSASRRWRLWPIPFRRVKTLERSSSTASIDEVFVDPESVSRSPSSEANPTSQNNTPKSETVLKSPRKKIIRTNIPTSEQIASLNLKEGQNNVTFSFSTRVLGLQQVEAHIYLWRWNAQIVISDVDGTITKSDVLGQFMPLVGKDWSQFGVAQLFSAIKENGYHLLFLSARAIVQAYLTKSFLFNLKQDGKRLPTGPVVISPNGLFPSLFREVIRRAPHEFKIACLEDIKALFPPDYNPFYAGFGNRDTDELTYRKIGIPKGKIFIINPKGEVAINHRIDVKSYTSLHTLVDDMFPPTSMVQQEDYNSWNYWKMPLPDIND